MMRMPLLTAGGMAAVLLVAMGCAFSPADMPARYAIVYGVSEYDDTNVFLGSVNLAYPAKDARDVAAALRREGYDVILREDTAATKEQLVRDIDDMASRADTDGILLFYFSGHGYGSGKEASYADSTVADVLGEIPGREPAGGGIDEYLFLYGSLANTINAEGNGTEVIIDAALAVTDDELASLIARVPTLGSVVIADICHAGGLIGETHYVDLTPRQGGAELSFLGRIGRSIDRFGSTLGDADFTQPRTLVLAASGEREFAWEPNPGTGGTIQNGFFTHYFLEGARLGDRNGDGYVSALELHRYTTEAIVRYVNPVLGADAYRPRTNGGALDFVIFGQ